MVLETWGSRDFFLRATKAERSRVMRASNSGGRGGGEGVRRYFMMTFCGDEDEDPQGAKRSEATS